MTRFIEGQDRQQVALLSECLDDFIAQTFANKGEPMSAVAGNFPTDGLRLHAGRT